MLSSNFRINKRICEIFASFWLQDHKLTRKISDSDISSDFDNKQLSTEICVPNKLDEANIEDMKESHWMLINSLKDLKAALMSDWQNK